MKLTKFLFIIYIYNIRQEIRQIPILMQNALNVRDASIGNKFI